MRNTKEPAPAPGPGGAARASLGARLRAPLLFLALALALYGNTLGNGFVFDDDLVVVKNADIRGLDRIGAVLRSGYRPVRHLSYALDYAVFGPHAWGFHLTNVLLHAVACLLVLRLASRLLDGHGPRTPSRSAWAAALLFAVHPVETEAVAYVSGRRDLLVTIFFLLGFLSYLRFRENGRKRHVVALLAWLALAAGSKESAITLPAVLLLHDLIVDRPTRRGWLFHVPFAALAAAFAVHVMLGDASQQQGFHGGSAKAHYLAVPCLYGLYLWRFVFPARLLADYSYDAFPLPRSPIAPSFLASALALAALVASVVLLRRRAPPIAFGIAWFLVTLLPVVQIVPFHELAAEHHLYLASIGLCVAAGSLAGRVARRPAAVAAAAVLLVALSARTVSRNRDWKDAETFWRVTARDAPRCARAQYNVGFLLAMQGRSEEAIAPLRAAVDIRGDTLERYALGCALLETGREAEGRRELGRALEVARAEDDPSVSCGTILMALGRNVEALLQFEAELRRRPWNPRPRFQKGLCHEAMGDDGAALKEYEQLIAAVSSHQPALLRAAEIAERRGEKERAARWRAMAEERTPPR